MLGIAVIGVAATLLPSLFSPIDQASQKARATATMIAVEAALVDALQENSNFTSVPATLSALQNGITSSASTTAPPITLRSISNAAVVVSGVSTPTYYAVDGSQCTASEFASGSAQCFLKVTVEIKNFFAEQSYRAAYRLMTGSAVRKWGALQSVGAPLKTTGAVEAFGEPATATEASSGRYGDYTFAIPIYFGNSTGVACPNGSIAKGYHSGTNTLTCWDPPTLKCAAGQFLMGIKAVGTRLQPDCVAGNDPRLECEDDYYALQSFGYTSTASPRAFGKCIYAGAASVSKTKRSCPVDYEQVASSCNLRSAFTSLKDAKDIP